MDTTITIKRCIAVLNHGWRSRPNYLCDCFDQKFSHYQ